MTEAAITVKDLHKEFVVSHSGASSIKTALLWWKRRRLETLKVLNGLTFSVAKGQCVGLIGRNGAGKSTLLSLIARVYRPTSGTLTVHGRVAPLLELGAGFHPDLTGLENILFNAMILGLSRRDAVARTETIVEFAELGPQIDAPVRTFSSGMLARLGFAIAVNVDADVLIVDEVLAVGDFRFEEKCYRKIEEFKSEGRTILFVSHQTEPVVRVADRCLLLEGGKVKLDGDPRSVIDEYHRSG
jgi:ABC-type polysaccharide/polyol phosphate transport system ATPase subunit